MLVLSRKKNERIVINNNVTVMVVDIRGDKVRLGIEAPKEVSVHRSEVYEAIKRRESPRPITPPQQFRSELALGNYEKAFDIFYEHEKPDSRSAYEIGTKQEINEMVQGLE